MKTSDVIARHDPRFVYPTSRADALRLLERVRARIEALDDLERFPEGAGGVIAVSLLAELAQSCPDVGDLGHQKQGLEAALASGLGAIAESDFG